MNTFEYSYSLLSAFKLNIAYQQNDSDLRRRRKKLNKTEYKKKKFETCQKRMYSYEIIGVRIVFLNGHPQVYSFCQWVSFIRVFEIIVLFNKIFSTIFCLLINHYFLFLTDQHHRKASICNPSLRQTPT